MFSFRNILYRLDERTNQFSVLLEALEHYKLHQSNETIQAALSEVLNSISSAQVYFKAGLDVFETTLAGKKWENSLHSKTFVYNSLNKSSTRTRISLRMKPFSTFLSVGAKMYCNVCFYEYKTVFCTVHSISQISVSECIKQWEGLTLNDFWKDICCIFICKIYFYD